MPKHLYWSALAAALALMPAGVCRAETAPAGKPAILDVRSDPPGASVWVNGDGREPRVGRGTTPYRVDASAAGGRPLLFIRREGFQMVRMWAEAPAGKTTVVDVKLTPLPPVPTTPGGPVFTIVPTDLPGRPASTQEFACMIVEGFHLNDRALFPVPPDAPKPPANHLSPESAFYWAFEPLYQLGLGQKIAETSLDNRVRPVLPITGWQWAIWLERLCNILEERAKSPDAPFAFAADAAKPLRTEPYPDVPADFRDSVEAMRLKGVFADVPEFRGNRPRTRQEMAEDLGRLAALFRRR